MYADRANGRYREAETEGVERVAADDSAETPLLGDTELAELTRAARIIESTLNSPQDVEWAVDEKGRLFFLQCRPLELETPHLDIEETATRPAPLVSGGRTGAGGAAVGQVFVIRKEADMFRFPDNSILAANTASPRYAPLIPHAAALVAEHGSKAGHLANVAREFGIPALFGIKDCADTLEDAGTVTVDADAGCIYPGAHTEMIRPKNVSNPRQSGHENPEDRAGKRFSPEPDGPGLTGLPAGQLLDHPRHHPLLP